MFLHKFSVRSVKPYLFVVVPFCALVLFLINSWAPDLPVEALVEKYAPVPSQFIAVSGLKLHVRDEGPASDPLPIVLLHGTSASLHTWDGWTQQLTAERRVLRFDLPGFGLTGPAPDNNYTIERYASTVVALLDARGISRCILVGNSLGGHIAWATGLLHPDRVAKLVLLDSSGIAFQSSSVPLGFKLAKIEYLQWFTQHFLPRFIVASSVKNVYAKPDLVTEQLIDRYYDLTRRVGNRQALNDRFMQTQPGPLSERITEIAQPTLILWGEEDKLIPIDVANSFNSLIPNSQLIILPGVGHVPQEEAPLVSLRAVEDFL